MQQWAKWNICLPTNGCTLRCICVRLSRWYVYTGCCWGKLKGKKALGRPWCRYQDNNGMDLQQMGSGVWNGLIWLRIGTSGGLLWMRQWTFGFHKMRGISWLAKKLLASQRLQYKELLHSWLVGYLDIGVSISGYLFLELRLLSGVLEWVNKCCN